MLWHPMKALEPFCKVNRVLWAALVLGKLVANGRANDHGWQASRLADDEGVDDSVLDGLAATGVALPGSGPFG